MAGLGGGSSDAVATLKALNFWNLAPLPFEELKEIATQLGSDCPGFLVEGACVASGRGEEVRPLSKEANDRLDGNRLILFKPPIGFSTAAVYSGLNQKEDAYSSRESAYQRIEAWEKGEADPEELMGNDLEGVVLSKYFFVRPLFDILFRRFGVRPMLSGSGSCCFAFVPHDCPVHEVFVCIKDAWGRGAFVAQQQIRS